VRLATKDDMRKVLAWLREEQLEGRPGNFLCNWNVIEAEHKRRAVIVCVDRQSGAPVGFFAGSLATDAIVGVKYGLRGSGIGRALVERAVERSEDRDEHLLLVECAPITSVPFWEGMGFTRVGEKHAYRVLPVKHELPPGAARIDVTIRFYPEEKKWHPDVQPLHSYAPVAVRISAEEVQLAERVFFFAALHPDARNVVAEVILGSTTVYADKVKYPEGERIGFKRCRNGYQIDKIRL
jgi:GNAT superfamily N-acetyltransferase